MNLPNKITLARILLIPVFITAFYCFPDMLWISAIIFAIAAATDFLDGYLARKNNQVTDMGKFLDPIADKALVMSGLILLLSKMEQIVTNSPVINVDFYVITFAILSVLILARELIVSGFRQIAAAKNIVIAADSTGKMKAVFQYIAVVLYLISPLFADVEFYFIIAFMSLVMAAILSVYSAFEMIWFNKSVLLEKRPQTKEIQESTIEVQNSDKELVVELDDEEDGDNI